MFLFETEKGDKWVCKFCIQEQEELLKEKKWKAVLDSDDPTLRCVICGNGEYDYED